MIAARPKHQGDVGACAPGCARESPEHQLANDGQRREQDDQQRDRGGGEAVGPLGGFGAEGLRVERDEGSADERDTLAQ